MCQFPEARCDGLVRSIRRVIGCNPLPMPCSVVKIGTVRPFMPWTVYCSPSLEVFKVMLS